MRSFLRLLGVVVPLGLSPLAHAGERTASALREVLPKFDPAKSAAAQAVHANKVARPVAEDGVTILPDFQVMEKKVETPPPDQWLRGAEVTRRETRRAAAEMSPLELALNRWHIPFLMPSFADRARANYETKKRSEEMKRLESLQRLPGGN